jgi:hypothetical protein
MDSTRPRGQGASAGSIQLDDEEEGGVYPCQWKEGGLVQLWTYCL